MRTENSKAVLVLGGGVSGVQASLDLIAKGLKVHLVEQCPSLGGLMAQLEKTFPTHDCAYCQLEPKLVDTLCDDRIDMITNTRVEKVEGKAGNFRVTLRKNGLWVDPSKCNDCGACIESCHARAVQRYHAVLGRRGRPGPGHGMSAGTTKPIYFFDPDRCDLCGSCEKACKGGAIIREREPQRTVLQVAAIVLATGARTFDPSSMTEYGYGLFPNVMTSLDLERALSAPGPKAGLVTRPSDGAVPKRVAFIQCVGSRDERTNTYCSSVCCMAAIKQSIMLVERFKVMVPTIFHIDIRAFGKGFETYYTTSASKYGVRFENSRVSGIEETDGHDLVVNFIDKEGTAVKERFDLVVLSVGLVPPRGAKALATALGIELTGHGFPKVDDLAPLRTTVDGIFVAGASQAPKDIPDSVTDAIAAALLASGPGPAPMTLTGSNGGNEPAPLPTIDASKASYPRTGVFGCRCPDEKGTALDLKGLMSFAAGLPNVVHTEELQDLCNEEARKVLRERIEEKGINRVVCVGCSPRLIEPILRRTIKEAGLNPFLLEVANIREQCGWVHGDDPKAANEKAKDLVRMAVRKVADDVPLPIVEVPIERAILVLGGGVSGMTAALALSAKGVPVYLVEKGDRLGGHLQHIRYLFDGESDPQAHLAHLVERVKGDKNIQLHLQTCLVTTEGVPGLFTSALKGPGGEITVKHGAAIIATGGTEYRPKEFLYGKCERVVTQAELEGLIVTKQFEGLAPRTVVMIQCVGARNKEHPECSRICCIVAVKNALRIKSIDPGTEVFVLYKDVRTYGFTEDRYREARGKGVHFIRYSDEAPPVVRDEGGRLSVDLKDTVIGKRLSIQTDLLVLSAAVHPNPDNEQLAKVFKVAIGNDGFLLETHMKMSPVDFSTEGVFLCGLAHGPKDLGEAMVQALAAASHAYNLLAKGHLTGEVIIAQVNPDKCRGCGRCEEACEFAAIHVVTEAIGNVERMVSKVDPARCKGCGRCSVVCCNKSIAMGHFTTAQVNGIVGAALGRWP